MKSINIQKMPKQCNRVISLQDLINVIIPHFIKYPLNTQKRADFELLLMVVELMIKKNM